MNMVASGDQHLVSGDFKKTYRSPGRAPSSLVCRSALRKSERLMVLFNLWLFESVTSRKKYPFAKHAFCFFFYFILICFSVRIVFDGLARNYLYKTKFFLYVNFRYSATSANKHVMSKQNFNSGDFLAISFYQ